MVDTISEGARSPLPKNLLHADDLAMVAEGEEELQERVVKWQEILENKGLRPNRKKIKEMISSKLGRKVKIKDRNYVELKQVE